MLPPKFKIFQNIFLTSRCDFMCLNCELWSQPEQALEVTPDFSQKLPAVINLCGGDPLLSSRLGKILAQLKKHNKYVALTTNPLHMEKIATEIYQWIDLPIIYMPEVLTAKLSAETGLAALDKYLDLFNYFTEIQKKFLVIFPVTSLSFEQIPEAVELIGKYKYGRLLLNYQPHIHGELDPLQKGYLQHYSRRSQILVYAVRRQTVRPEVCLGVIPELEIINFKNLWFGLKLWAKLYF